VFLYVQASQVHGTGFLSLFLLSLPLPFSADAMAEAAAAAAFSILRFVERIRIDIHA